MGGGKNTIEIVVALRDQVTRQLGALEKRFSTFSRKMEETASASRKFALAMAGVGAGAGALGLNMIRLAADFEQSMVAFETMLGSAEKAEKFYKELLEFAKKTPFEVKGLEDAAKKLLAYGISADQVLEDLKALGDVAAGVGMEKLPQLILAFGQVAAKGRLTGEELRQLLETGAPIREEIAKLFGTTKEEVDALIDQNLVKFEDLRKVFQNLTGEGGRFFDLMEKQSQTLAGRWSNLQDAWNQFLMGEGQKLLEWAGRFVEILAYLVSEVLPRVVQAIEGVVNWFKQNQWAVYALAGAIVAMLLPALGSLVAAIAGVVASLAPLAIGGAVIGAVIYGFITLAKNNEWLVETISNAWNKAVQFTEAAADAYGRMANAIASSVQWLRDTWTAAWEWMTQTVQNASAFVQALVDGLLGWIFGKWQALVAHTSAAWNAAKNVVLGALQALRDTATAIVESVVSRWQWLVDNLAGAIQRAVQMLSSTLDSIKSKVAGVLDWIVEKARYALELLGRLGKAVWDYSLPGMAVNAFRGITGLAEGGIVQKPTLAMVGEGGEPEAVIPLSRLRGMGTTVNITITGNTFYGAEDVEDLANVLARRLRSEMRL